jgi:hypothetical protein
MSSSRNSLVKKSLKTAFAFASLLVIASPVQAVPESVPIEKQVKDVVSHLVGVMDTSAQAAATPNAPNVRMTTCQVTVENADALNTAPTVFLYQEQALSQKLTAPYRQRFLQISPSTDGQTVESMAFKPPTPETLIGLCDRPEAKRLVQQSQLGERACSVFLKPSGENYVGETPPEGCPTNVRGAVRITNTIVLHKAGMDTLDRGFDAAGNRVWGAKDQPYQFRWINK